jgi:hypothetical protein
MLTLVISYYLVQDNQFYIKAFSQPTALRAFLPTCMYKLFIKPPLNLHTNQYAPITMKHNCSMESLKGIRFGYGFIANQKSLKLRFKMERATAIFKRLPAHFHQHLSVYINLKGEHVIIACVAHASSHIWFALEQAIILSEADIFYAKAQNIDPSRYQ